MRARTQITILATTAALSLGIGIPVLAVTIKPSSEEIRGTVVSLVPDEHAVLIHAVSGSRKLRGHTILVRVRTGQLVRTSHGDEDVERLLPGQPVSAHLRPGSLLAQDIIAAN
jgi:hypothetical protein